MWTLERASHTARLNLRWQEALDLALGAIRMASSVSNPTAEITAHYHIACEMLRRGDLVGARGHAAQGLQRAERTRQRWLYAQLAWLHVALAEGNFAGAARLLELSQTTEERSLGWMSPVIEAQLEAWVTGPGAAHPRLQCLAEHLAQLEGQLWGTMPTAIWFEGLAHAARIAGDTHHLDYAARLARAALVSAEALPMQMLLSHVVLAMAAIQQGDAQEASVHYQALLPHAGMASPGSGMLLDRLLGLLAGTMGEPDRAAEHFEDALAFARKGGYRPELAWTCCDYADLLRQRSAPGDAARATALLDEALALAQEMGMRPLVERVQARRGTQVA